MFRFLPWKMIVRRAARAYGIMDPAMWLARLRQFSQPSEVQEPIELLRAGIHFHARGLINTKAIQHNLDWVWPYWVERQFDPADDSFVPRAFSFSHINLTHRNWTAVGLPELSLTSIVDPRGLVTPLHDGWSLDFWLSDAEGRCLIPSQVTDDGCEQSRVTDPATGVRTNVFLHSMQLQSTVTMVVRDDQPVLRIQLRAMSEGGGHLAVGVRPYNPEGIQFVDTLKSNADRKGWVVNDDYQILTDRPADRLLTSHYDHGDVVPQISSPERDLPPPTQPVTEQCDQGMATGASVFHFSEDEFQLEVTVPLQKELEAQGEPARFQPSVTWPDVRMPMARLAVPNFRIQQLYEAAVDSLVLLSVDEIVPGPYTYRRFWFRDACLMMHPMLAIGMVDRCQRMLEKFPERQQRNGYFRSQNGEWDSNGQVLWILDRFRRMTHRPISKSLLGMLDKAVDWLADKRVPMTANERHAGLLPAGFSAEHLGPNDFYYWDDFWAEAGLRAAADIWFEAGKAEKADRALRLAEEFKTAVERSLQDQPHSRTLGGIPASPYRRMDAGAIGSMVIDYPLQLTAANDEQVNATLEALLQSNLYLGGFFQDMIHSGINAYLTLDLAQTLLRNGDPRYRELMDSVAQLATSTGHWPEAIHPRTAGGCMGDGQHGWASGEWVMMVRNLFVREEEQLRPPVNRTLPGADRNASSDRRGHGRLVIGSGLYREWFQQDSDLSFGPTLTAWGTVSVRVVQPKTNPMVVIDGHWHSDQPRIDICIPGFEPVENASIDSAIALKRASGEDLRVHDPSAIVDSEVISRS